VYVAINEDRRLLQSNKNEMFVVYFFLFHLKYKTDIEHVKVYIVNLCQSTMSLLYKTKYTTRAIIWFGQLVYPGLPVSSTIKTDHRDIMEYCWKWR
jgi:hypothetical protein